MSIKLLFLDMEGTIYAKQHVRMSDGEISDHNSLWSRLMKELGENAISDNEKTIEKWENGVYKSYLEWCDESVRNLARHGLTKELFQEIMYSIDYNPEVKETISEVHRRGIKTAIISGGFAHQTKRAQVDLKINHACSAVEIFWDEQGKPSHWNIFPSDFEGKVDYVKLLSREYKLSLTECAFIGDGKNDVQIAKEVSVSFAYQAHEQLKKNATYTIDRFSEILKFI
ncbi:HAD family hydrolase [Gynuella sunshinyii]|uniref:phosphoserine phosphatase n=2 Tax=Gynuella sunshinyii TaxID=1445505 RepID=A0A0C5VI94_9GAMM|nr:HAD family hydrolase [Gynuella sunshinyii]AII80610.1 haloacid dehalogenase superfamily protein [Gynuella sunshinyii YC6258]AJQ93078.1 phosphoserine phosphatase [Gynuella sunshinyii YC6258]